MPTMKPTDNTKLLEQLANHLDGRYNRYHLNYGEAELVASVWLAYKVAGKEEHFPSWLAVAVAEDLISPYSYLREEETAASVLAIPQGCQQVWDEYWRKPARQR